MPITYIVFRGCDSQYWPVINDKELTLRVYSISIFTDVRYTLHGEGYCSATDTQSKTDPVEVEGSDFDTKEVTLVFKGKGCEEPRKVKELERAEMA